MVPRRTYSVLVLHPGINSQFSILGYMTKVIYFLCHADILKKLMQYIEGKFYREHGPG